MMERKEALEAMLAILDRGEAVLTAGKIHPAIPTIHDVGHRDGQLLRTGTEVKHHGFGLFSAETESGHLSFDGGGAMQRAEKSGKWSFSWTPLRADPGVLEDLGYDVAAVRAAVARLLAEE